MIFVLVVFIVIEMFRLVDSERVCCWFCFRYTLLTLLVHPSNGERIILSSP